MQRIVQVGVVLLNVVWITFFLTPDPDFSVFVQRRSSSSYEKMFLREFCLQPGSDRNWTTVLPSVSPAEKVNTITTPSVNGKRKIPQKEEFNSGEKIPTSASTEHNTDQICSCANGGETTKCYRKTPNFSSGTCSENKDRDLDAFTLSTHEHRLTLSEVTSLPMLSYSSEAALVTKIPTTPKNQKIDIIHQEINLRPLRPERIGPIVPGGCCFKFFQKPVNKMLITSLYMTAPHCPLRAAIIITKKSRRICVDPKQPWVKQSIRFLEYRSF
ncbi:hypothetical protein ATANTOWER_016677 [Ataeniobius toweri]|uniref:Chemokine interleukin-8-like domain-containing protein n=1 Tax=Ataeniobius toweri TaxID=208326 RepID=A0ABU7BBF9_9TELE|nr:hypothetical protein [Ataeniobius toweri]